MDGTRQVVASTVFVPVAAAPVVSAYMRNCSGNGGAGDNVPTRIGVGNWQILVPLSFDQLRISITKRATTAAGGLIHVSATLAAGANPTVAPTQVNIFTRDTAGAPVEVGVSFVEVTIARLPL